MEILQGMCVGFGKWLRGTNGTAAAHPNLPTT